MSSHTLAEIKKAIRKHNKDVDNDVKVSVKDGELMFSSAKAEKVKLQLPQAPKTMPKKKAPAKKKMSKPMKGQGDLTKMGVTKTKMEKK